MIYADCKRYAERNKVGVDAVRGLYGVVEKDNATSGLIITTSFFTKTAIEERNEVKHRMALADFNDVKKMMLDWAGIKS
jgi:restriction system protein